VNILLDTLALYLWSSSGSWHLAEGWRNGGLCQSVDLLYITEEGPHCQKL